MFFFKSRFQKVKSRFIFHGVASCPFVTKNYKFPSPCSPFVHNTCIIQTHCSQFRMVTDPFVNLMKATNLLPRKFSLSTQTKTNSIQLRKFTHPLSRHYHPLKIAYSTGFEFLKKKKRFSSGIF